MRVFVTGATGFIGMPTVKELIAAGHQVLGLSRSDEGAQALKQLGADVQRGSLEDLDSLRDGAESADAVIHLAFIHDFSKFAENCAIDQRAIETLGSALEGSNKSFIVTSGTGVLNVPGKIVTEEDNPPADSPMPRVSEQTALSFVSKGVKASVMRLPQVHDALKQGLVPYVIATAREKGVSVYVGDGSNRWPAAHISDVAHLYRLALEKNEAGAKYHAVDEEGVSMKAIAETIAKGLKVPVKSISAEEAQSHFGWLSMFASRDLAASSAITRKKLGWNPKGPGMITDLENMNYN